MKKIITIIGARPQIIKSAAINRAIRTNFKDELKEVIVHTGQHYDQNMSNVFFDEMGISSPNYNLGVGSGTHGSQTAEMIQGIEDILLKENPDALLVYGDTNSTLAAAIAASKIHVPIIHVEAGLRSYNKSMPEEVNRIVCDHLSTLLFSPTISGVKNLEKEGFTNSEATVTVDNPKVFHCGDVMYDNSLYFSDLAAEKATVLKDNQLLDRKFILCTIHRNNNTDDAVRLTAIFNALLTISQIHTDLDIVLPLHPRTKSCLAKSLNSNLLNELNATSSIKIIDPVSFLNIISLEKNCELVITDSGGLQKEAFFFKKPCVILRPETEWIEIVENGNAIIADANEKVILEAVNDFLSPVKQFTYPNFYGDGNAANFICEQILKVI